MGEGPLLGVVQKNRVDNLEHDKQTELTNTVVTSASSVLKPWVAELVKRFGTHRTTPKVLTTIATGQPIPTCVFSVVDVQVR